LVSLFDEHQVKEVYLAGALNVNEQEGVVLGAQMNGASPGS
jgi:hypothetical protein